MLRSFPKAQCKYAFCFLTSLTVFVVHELKKPRGERPKPHIFTIEKLKMGLKSLLTVYEWILHIQYYFCVKVRTTHTEVPVLADSTVHISGVSVPVIFSDCANNVNSCNKSESNRSGCVMRGSLQFLESVHRAPIELEEPCVNEVSN